MAEEDAQPLPQGPIIDPTKNVLDLVRAEGTKRDEFRTVDALLLDAKIDTLRAEQRVLTAMTEGHRNLQSAMRDADSRRLDQLAQQRETYEKRIADMLSESVRSTSALVSTQLVQIQSTFDARVSKLEEFRLLSTGRSSVADPALAASLDQMSATIQALKTTGTTREGRGLGHSETINWVIGAVGLVTGMVVAIAAVIALHNPTVQPTVQYVPAPTAVPAPVTVPR